MAKLEGISIDVVRETLDNVEPKATKQLMVAMLYKQGPPVPMIAEWYDMRDETIYCSPTEMEEEPLKEQIFDESPPCRPSKLTDAQRKQFKETLHHLADNIGYYQLAWTGPLAERLKNEFDVTYHEHHVWRLMADFGVSRQSPRPQPPTIDGEERAEAKKDLKKV